MSNPDVEAPGLAVEVKHRRKLPDWIKQGVNKAVQGRKNDQEIGVLWLHEHLAREDYVVLRSSDFLKLLAKALGATENDPVPTALPRR